MTCTFDKNKPKTIPIKIPKIEKREEFVIFNPGSPSLPKKGDGSFGIIEVLGDSMIFRLLDLEGRVLEDVTFP